MAKTVLLTLFALLSTTACSPLLYSLPYTTYEYVAPAPPAAPLVAQAAPLIAPGAPFVAQAYPYYSSAYTSSVVQDWPLLSAPLTLPYGTAYDYYLRK